MNSRKIIRTASKPSEKYRASECRGYVLEIKYPHLLDGGETTRLSVEYDPTSTDCSAYSVSGTVEAVRAAMIEDLDEADRFYATVSASEAAFAVLMIVLSVIIFLAVRNSEGSRLRAD